MLADIDSFVSGINAYMDLRATNRLMREGDVATVILRIDLEELPTAQPDVKEEKKGPRVGSPQPAIDGEHSCRNAKLGKRYHWLVPLPPAS